MVAPIYVEQALCEQEARDRPLEEPRANDVAILQGRCASAGGGIVYRWQLIAVP